MAVYAPSHEGQARALSAAYANAGVGAETVELVEGHGTGTKVGDAVEVRGLNQVYRSAREEGTWCALGSAKSQIGHTKAAAGAAGLIKACLALYHRVLPPTAKVEQPNEAVAPGETPFYVNTVKRPWLPNEDHPRRAAVSSFGFGGTNFHCVLEEHDHPAGVDWDGDVQLYALSGGSPQAILDQLARLGADLDSDQWDRVRITAAASREEFDSSAHCRLIAVVRT